MSENMGKIEFGPDYKSEPIKIDGDFTLKKPEPRPERLLPHEVEIKELKEQFAKVNTKQAEYIKSLTAEVALLTDILNADILHLAEQMDVLDKENQSLTTILDRAREALEMMDSYFKRHRDGGGFCGDEVLENWNEVTDTLIKLNKAKGNG